MTREDWLTARITDLRPWFTAQALTVPDGVRVSCGWPSTKALSNRRKRIGECWPETSSADGHHELFISPAIAEPVEVVAVLIHELIHATVGCKHGHKKEFSRAARALGLVKPWTATTAGPELTERLNALISTVPAYPHAVLTANTLRKKQSTRLLKAGCSDCGYVIRVTQRWADTGLPTCVCGSEMELAS
jgi:hypothetical protein